MPGRRYRQKKIMFNVFKPLSKDIPNLHGTVLGAHCGASDDWSRC